MARKRKPAMQPGLGFISTSAPAVDAPYQVVDPGGSVPPPRDFSVWNNAVTARMNADDAWSNAPAAAAAKTTIAIDPVKLFSAWVKANSRMVTLAAGVMAAIAVLSFGGGSEPEPRRRKRNPRRAR